MNKSSRLSIIVIIFLAGYFASVAMPMIESSINIPLNKNNLNEVPGLLKAKELNSPYDHIKEEQIKLYDDRVVILLENPEWASFTDTNSMDPLIDYGSNAIEIVPKFKEEV
ncbi:MAG: hypothetical protein KAQ83_03640, partial [Nanoarchaeota archaeon]|nr:hypothetical protein [Nanoarchaeota archaeon]